MRTLQLLLARAAICAHVISSTDIDDEYHHTQLLQTKAEPAKKVIEDALMELRHSDDTSLLETGAAVTVKQEPEMQEAVDDPQVQVAQLAAAVQTKDAMIRSLEAELDRVKAQRAQETGHKVAPYITLPEGTTAVKINVGTNYNPMVECDASGTIVCLLFDIQNKPIQALRELYKDNANTYVFALGVSEYEGLAAFPALGYGEDAQSASLSDPNAAAAWNTGENRGSMDFSGVITLAEVIDSIDPAIQILMLATDMQGHDFAAIKSAGDRLKRVRALEVELYKDGVSTYAGVNNDYAADWLPHMTKLGFIEATCEAGYVEPGVANEWNCLWVPAA